MTLNSSQFIKHAVHELSIVMLLFIIAFSTAANSNQLSLTVLDENNIPVNQVVIALMGKPSSITEANKLAVMDQRGNAFLPDVLIIPTNTAVHFPNSDDIRHHVYSFSPAKRFELRLYHGQTAEPVLFDKPGQVILGCNIHDSMLGYIYVVDSDYFGMSDAQGKVNIKNIPVGKYQLQIQHPRLDPEQQLPIIEVVIDEKGSDKLINLSNLLPDPRARSSDNELDNLFKK